MQFVQHPTTNKLLGAPEGYDHSKGPCLALPVTVVPDSEEQHARIESYWQLTGEERAAIERGALLKLSIIGVQHPPVALAVEAVDPGALDAVDAAYRRGILEGGTSVFNTLMEHPSNQGRGLELFAELKAACDNALVNAVVPRDPDEQPLWEDLIENAFWDMDARLKAYGPFPSVATGRDAFFAAVRGMLAKKLPAPDEENMRLRQLLCDVLAALGNGAGAQPIASMEFLSHVPEEVRLVVDDLRKDVNAPRGTDDQILKERELTASAIDGAIAFGFQGVQEAPADHWLRKWWSLGHDQALLQQSLAMMIRMLCSYGNTDNMKAKAIELLRKHDLQGSPLRQSDVAGGGDARE